MDTLNIAASGPLVRDLAVPGDKSVSHRALLFAALAEGTTRIEGLQSGLDVLASRRAVEALGAVVHDTGDAVQVEGRGLGQLVEPADVIDCANSGTTMRLLSGILAGQSFLSVLTGDRHLRRRPMARVLDPCGRWGPWPWGGTRTAGRRWCFGAGACGR